MQMQVKSGIRSTEEQIKEINLNLGDRYRSNRFRIPHVLDPTGSGSKSFRIQQVWDPTGSGSNRIGTNRFRIPHVPDSPCSGSNRSQIRQVLDKTGFGPTGSNSNRFCTNRFQIQQIPDPNSFWIHQNPDPQNCQLVLVWKTIVTNLLQWADLAQWQHCSSTCWKPGFDSHHPRKPWGLVTHSCNPATGGQGYFDCAGHLGLNTWLGLDWLVSLLGLETKAESDLHKRNGF